MLSGAVVVKRGRRRAGAAQRRGRSFVVRRMHAALQRRRIQADLLQNGLDGRNVERFPGMRGRHHRDFTRFEPKPLGDAGFDRCGGDERFCTRTQVDRRFDIAGLELHASIRIYRAGRHPMNGLDAVAAGYVDEQLRRAQTSAGSTIVASWSAKTGLLR